MHFIKMSDLANCTEPTLLYVYGMFVNPFPNLN